MPQRWLKQPAKRRKALVCFTCAISLLLLGRERGFVSYFPLRASPRGGGSGITSGPRAKKLTQALPDSAEAGPEAAKESGAGRVIILGAGLHGAALAYYLTLRGVKPLVVEKQKVAAAASGKGGGFLARDWGDQTTQQLHKVSFRLHEELAETLKLESYRKLPVLAVTPGRRTSHTKDLCPWLDGDYSNSRVMDADGGAQVAPHELCTKLMDAALSRGAELRIGSAEGIETELDEESGLQQVVGVTVDGEVIPADKVSVCLGPWAAHLEDWLGLVVPMTGIKSTSIVFQSKDGNAVEPYALFCGEDDRFGTHLEVYPRKSGEVYICGVGGSQYIDARTLRSGGMPPADVNADPARVKAATASFSMMSKKLGGPDAAVASQACMRPCLADALPMMGKVPHVKGAYVSAGHNCWGILWAPVSGLAMSELIVDGEAKSVNLSKFSPGRFGVPQASVAGKTRGRKRGLAPVGEQW